MSEELYNLSSLKAISRGNEAFVRKMVGVFCDQTPGMLKEMMEAYDAGDFQRMGSLAHKMKPSIDNLNILTIKHYIRDVEAVGRDNVQDLLLAEKLAKINSVLNKALEQIATEYPDNN